MRSEGEDMSALAMEVQRDQQPSHQPETVKKTAPVVAEGDELAPGYTVVAHIRRGTALDVYEVWSAERSCRCVAKTLRPDCLNDPRDRRRVLREGRLLQRLTHPH